MREIWPFVLCGGAGTRLWPLSRDAYPKQFHRLAGPHSLFQQTCRRLSGDLFAQISILSNRQHRFLVADQLHEIGVEAARSVLEPINRNTAPAACIAALIAHRSDTEALVLLAPSDHVIADDASFAASVQRGIDAARKGALITFGVRPDCPHTGYGYIESDSGKPDQSGVFAVRRFVEKPSKEAAASYLESGRFFWNAGIFLFDAKVMLRLFETLAPEIISACQQALDTAVEDLNFLVLGNQYCKAQAISLDYAIVEKADNIGCVPLNTAWSDVGSCCGRPIWRSASGIRSISSAKQERPRSHDYGSRLGSEALLSAFIAGRPLELPIQTPTGRENKFEQGLRSSLNGVAIKLHRLRMLYGWIAFQLPPIPF